MELDELHADRLPRLEDVHQAGGAAVAARRQRPPEPGPDGPEPRHPSAPRRERPARPQTGEDQLSGSCAADRSPGEPGPQRALPGVRGEGGVIVDQGRPATVSRIWYSPNFGIRRNPYHAAAARVPSLSHS